MRAEWHQITGQSHATVPPHKAEQRFDALVYILETRKVTEAQNQELMAPIAEKEVRKAITALHRNKAGGVDSLSNDFYKDCEGAMVGVLVQEFNNIRCGAPMPRSFGQGIVIPLRKKGDSSNPLDYRLITLLTTTYKLFAKVLATRLQDILLWIIGEEQQGFVRDRLMENAILIMQAALDKAYHSSTEGFDDTPGIAMLDFMKAYDTLDRDFLYLVLSKFGFGRQFVDLVRRMHSDTTAQYLVNGELSREWEVKSGIRQGCPLTPLLFIVAAEILALAVQQDPHLEGIRVTRSGAEPHLISTFVDDSAVFVKQGKQLPRLMQLLSEFCRQSGLQVQPTKSSYICLNTAVVQGQRCGILHDDQTRVMMTRLEAGMRNLTRLAEAQAGDSDGHTLAAVLKAYVDCFLSQTGTIPLTPSDTRGVYLLFFDGGSRGNPGPGGTGSIIVRVHKDSHTASLIWAASMAYSRKDTTNNFAEYWGLIHGLREAQRSHFEPLYVIGDSALIISQQRMHRSPRQHRLARLYQTSRRLADCIDIRGWYHHYRAFNKMADSAANLAMDTRTSTQVHFPTQRAAFNNLTQDLDNDVMHWLMRSSEDPRSLDNTRQPHIGPREHAILVKDYLAFRSDLLQSAL
ncbi:Rxlr effector protein, partial [Globisporangium splendens]